MKMGVTRSQWSQVMKGTPQGSILGSYVFNIFQNDLMYLLNSLSDIYNYADDNTVGCMSTSFQQLKINLQISVRVRVLLHCYESNCMRGNPDKCQCIVGKEHESNESIAITDKTTLIPLDSCKLLGLEVDGKLMFKTVTKLFILSP